MDTQTDIVLAAVGHPDRAAILIELLERDAREKELVEALGISQKNANRHFSQLRTAGLIERDRRQGPYRITHPTEVRLLLETANRLALAVLTARSATESETSARLRRTRLKRAKTSSEDVGA